MGKISSSNDSKSWERTDWLPSTVSPVNDGLYEVLTSSKKSIIMIDFDDGKWQSNLPSVFQWRGLTKRQFESLPFELFFPPDSEEKQELVPCYSCGKEHYENSNDLLVWSGQYVCPDCGEGWIMSDSRDEFDFE